MSLITLPIKFINHHSKSYTLNEQQCNDNNCKHHKCILRIGGEYVPVFEIINFGNGNNNNNNLINKDLFYIRLTKQGLIISHKPSVNLNSLNRFNIQQTKNNNENISKKYSYKYPYLSSTTTNQCCNRTKSDRCRLIKWDHISGIQILKPKSILFRLNFNNDDNFESDSTLQLLKYKFCLHQNELPPIIHHINNNNNNDEFIKFEFLIKQDLEALIAFGIHYQLLQPDNQYKKSSTSINKNGEKKKFKKKNQFIKFINWITRNHRTSK